jgi:hypothetical protein
MGKADFRLSHFRRLAVVMEPDETLDLVAVTLLDSSALMTYTQPVPELVQQLAGAVSRKKILRWRREAVGNVFVLEASVDRLRVAGANASPSPFMGTNHREL